jgi:RNA polymerase sigma-70 factor (ECF subfamily)
MDREPGVNGQALERFRAYLRLFAEVNLHPGVRAKLDASDMVQQTLLQAYEGLAGFRGKSEAELAAWLRQILARNLAHSVRDLNRARRDVARERSLELALDASSAHLEAWLATDPQSSPSMHAQFNEEALRLAEALDRLPEAQREALVLQHWHNWSLADIGQHLDRSPAAVAGLIKRGLQQLRHHLEEGKAP